MSVYGKYNVTFGNANSTWARAAAMVGRGSRVLDVGCAAGQLAEALTAVQDCVVDGVEINPQDAALARQRCRRVWVGDVVALADELDGPYDHVVMLDVLEHMPDPAAALRAVARLVAPEGSVIVSVPNMAHASVRLQLLQGHFPAEEDGLLDRTHLRFFDEIALRELIAASPLTLVSFDRIVFDLLPATVEDALATVGLAPTSAFLEFISTREALTYQFVVRLTPSPSDGAAPKPARREYVAPLRQYWESVQALQSQVAELEDRLARRQSHSLRVPAAVVRAARSLTRLRRP